MCYYDGILVAEHKRLHERSQWQINIYHFTKTLLKKPGALASSVAFSKNGAQAFKYLQQILQRMREKLYRTFRYYIKNRDSINIKAVTTDKIITICQRMPLPINDKTTEGTLEIEESSRKILSLYGNLLNEKESELTEVV